MSTESEIQASILQFKSYLYIPGKAISPFLRVILRKNETKIIDKTLIENIIIDCVVY